MKHILASAILIVAAGLGLTTYASAQTEQIVTKIPFDFVVAGQALPAGSYRIEPTGEFLLFTNIDRHVTAYTTSYHGDPTLNGTSQLKFDLVSGKHFLRKIETPSTRTTMDFPVSRAERNAVELRASHDATAVTRGR